MSSVPQTEVWQRGPVPGYEPLLMPVVHALLQVREDLGRLAGRVPAEHLWLRPINVVTVKGRRSDMEIYELVGIRGGAPELEATPAQIRLCQLTQHAYEAFSRGDTGAALHRYTEIQAEFPDDPLCSAMIALCREPARLAG